MKQSVVNNKLKQNKIDTVLGYKNCIVIFAK